MVKYRIIILAFAVGFLFVSCSKQAEHTNNVNTNDNSTSKVIVGTSTPDIMHPNLIENDGKTRKFELIDEQKISINNEGKINDIKLFLSRDESMSIMSSIKISIDNVEDIYNLEPSIGLDNIKKIEFVNIGNNRKGIFISLFDTQNEKTTYWGKYNCIVFGFINGKIKVLLDGLKLPINNENNYVVNYLGSNLIQFKDVATNFSAKYEVTLDDINKDIVEKRLQHLNELKSSDISRNFLNLKLISTPSGTDIIECSKYIPGVTHNGVLGIIEYKFQFEQDKYLLSQEILKNGNSQEGIIIKSQDFTK